MLKNKSINNSNKSNNNKDNKDKTATKLLKENKCL